MRRSRESERKSKVSDERQSRRCVRHCCAPASIATRTHAPCFEKLSVSHAITESKVGDLWQGKRERAASISDRDRDQHHRKPLAPRMRSTAQLTLMRFSESNSKFSGFKSWDTRTWKQELTSARDALSFYLLLARSLRLLSVAPRSSLLVAEWLVSEWMTDSMHDSVHMAVFDTGDDLLEEGARLVLVQLAARHNVVEQLAVGAIFEHEVDIRWSVDHFV